MTDKEFLRQIFCRMYDEDQEALTAFIREHGVSPSKSDDSNVSVDRGVVSVRLPHQ